ncbi:hypothetical protein BGW37DRAFT_203741 [Umbelopsis sp. PMI_123]|nr:hypothetical protein BGW37DRAFT_203741 [Umbelopsis sp. PMI_123]
MTDKSDNMTRMYPQALLKQFRNLSEVPNWASIDINAKFDSDVNWYFEDTGDITSQQLDFLRIVVHEYNHGLGFLNSWNNYLWSAFQQINPNCTQFLTPMPLSPPNQLQSVYDQAQTADGPQPFWGFVEYPLDKLVRVNGTDQWLSAATTQLNGWGNSNVMFASLSDMYRSWQITSYNNIAYQIYNLSTQATSLAISNKNFGDVFLETSLNPFDMGSSLSHFDNSIYDNSDDYLMVYQADPGLNIQQYVTKRGGGPVGPKLLLILQTLGYDLVNASNSAQPKLTAWQQPKNMVGTTDNPSPSVSYVAAFASTSSGSDPTQSVASEAATGLSVTPLSLLVTMLAMLSLF